MNPVYDEAMTRRRRSPIAKYEWTSLPARKMRTAMEDALAVRSNSSPSSKSSNIYVISDIAADIWSAVDHERWIAAVPSSNYSSENSTAASIYSVSRNTNTVAVYRNSGEAPSSNSSIRGGKSRN